MLPFDLSQVVIEHLHGSQRPSDGLLHASSHLVGSLRHAQLEVAGAPQSPESSGQIIRLMTGTLWHDYLHSLIDGHAGGGTRPFINELSVNEGLPEGWGGTADWLIWSDTYNAYVLGDLKTTKGEGMSWLERDGIKDAHLWQVSAYWYALRNMGYPLVDRAFVMYLPMNDVPGQSVEPLVMETTLLDEDLVVTEMEYRWRRVQEYLFALPERTTGYSDYYLNDALEPVQPRVQKMNWNKTQNVFDVKLVPHWSATYCKFDSSLCDCSGQTANKIGHWTTDGVYVPRSGYELEFVDVQPTDRQLEQRAAA